VRAKPVRLVQGKGYVECLISEATHVTIHIPGPSEQITLPVILKGRREGTNCWSWNGSVDAPTLRPSVLTEGMQFLNVAEDAADPVNWRPFRCHTWINDGQAQFLDDCSHELRGQTLDLLEVTEES
jgi:hypothetical protein